VLLSFQEIMFQVVLWVYIINCVFLIDHEIESAYWQEWKLFKMRSGITFFVVLHFPIVFLILLGVKLLDDKSYYGAIIALFSGLASILGFIIHKSFSKQGKEGFDLPVSKFLLHGMLFCGMILSIACGFLLLSF
jgi:hypothetical protein